jgi:hypothetical protein
VRRLARHTSDRFEGGDTLTPEFIQEFLETIDCYVMGSRTNETALAFQAKARLVLLR